MPASSARSATKPITSLISSSSPSQAKLNLDCLPAASASMLTLMVPMASSFAVGAVNSRSSERQAQHGIADMVPTAAHRIVLLDRLGYEDRVSAAGQPWGTTMGAAKGCGASGSVGPTEDSRSTTIGSRQDDGGPSCNSLPLELCSPAQILMSPPMH